MHAITRRVARRVRTALGACGLIGGASAALVAGASRTAAAQNDTTAPALRLGDAYRELASHNPRVAAAKALADATTATVRSASLPPDPQVQLGFMNYALPDLRPMAPLGMVQLQIMQMIPLPGKLGLAGGAAQARSDAAHDVADGTYWTARTELADAFYDLYRLDAQLGVARRTIALLGDIEQTAQAMYRVGEASQPDVLRAQVEIARMTEDTLRMIAMRSGAAARFNAQLDRAADSTFGTLGTPALPAFPDAAPPLDSLLALATRDRPVVRAGRADVTAAERQRALAARDVWPDLAVGVQLGRQPGGVGNLMGSVMVGASIPVFMHARQGGARDAAAAMAEMSRADLRATEADTRASVFAAYADLLRARRLTALYRNTVLPQAEATAASALASYRVGHVDFMTVLDDRMTVNTYEQDLHQLESDEGNAWARLEALVAHNLINADSAVAHASGGSR